MFFCRNHFFTFELSYTVSAMRADRFPCLHGRTAVQTDCSAVMLMVSSIQVIPLFFFLILILRVYIHIYRLVLLAICGTHDHNNRHGNNSIKPKQSQSHKMWGHPCRSCHCPAYHNHNAGHTKQSE